ncbi:MAG: FadR/GntR family transcriptional regulator [Desulfobacterales bacterium]|jgi:GntR family transcriptional repressor for pyruvate dehydrogenase complex
METEASKQKNIGEGMFRPLQKKRFSDQIADLIQKKILEDSLEVGTNLPSEKAMAEEFQVSRSVIREALRILEISGLVNIKKGPTGGIFVSNVYHAPIKRSLNNLITSGEVTVDHLYDARLLIEPHIAGQAALNAGEEDLEKFCELFKDSAAHLDDPVRLKHNNLEFHLLLARASGNPVLAVMLESVFELLAERTLSFLDLELERKFFKIHKAIFEVFAKRQPEETSRLIREDIMDVMETLKKFNQQDKAAAT